ncbi:MAG: phosphonoacetate hydrolase [Hyphomicrobiaceae bacterium]|nr:phosphonoacetate hydrolase [Hyphomicrobiaceae bacterium]
MTDSATELNGVTYAVPVDPVAVVCIDGSDPEYFEAAKKAGVIPNIARYMNEGFNGIAHCVIPSFTCPNNMSIATGSPPKVHGISGNFYLDPDSGEPVVMTGPELMRSRTIFDVLSKAGARTVVVTAKDKLRRQLGKGLEVGNGNVCFSSQDADKTTMAENGIDDALGFVGQPLPDMYSEELSLFVLDAGIRFLEQDNPPALLYLSLTDYVQHKYAPDHPKALEFYKVLDDRFARLEELGAVVALVADHGMKDKCTADGSYNIVYLQDLLDERFGAGNTKVICPITDAFVGHHGSLGGFVRVHCFNGVNASEVIDFVRPIEGIEEVLGREDAAARFDLPFDVEADAVVISGENYCVGAAEADHDLAGLNGERLRTHGGISERDVPFVISRPLNETYLAKARSSQLKNYNIFEFAINGTT